MTTASPLRQELLATYAPKDSGLEVTHPQAHIEGRLKGICELATELFDVALAAVILHRKGEGWHVITAGRLALHPLPAEMSLALEALAMGQPLIIPDTQQRLGRHRMNSEPGWRMHFFAAIPFDIEGGRGAVCLLDRAGRELATRSRLKLETLAGLAAGLQGQQQYGMAAH